MQCRSRPKVSVASCVSCKLGGGRKKASFVLWIAVTMGVLVFALTCGGLVRWLCWRRDGAPDDAQLEKLEVTGSDKLLEIEPEPMTLPMPHSFGKITVHQKHAALRVRALRNAADVSGVCREQCSTVQSLPSQYSSITMTQCLLGAPSPVCVVGSL